MKTCDKDTRVVETIYPGSDYVEDFDTYGKRVFLTLKSNHSHGISVARIVLCKECQTQKAKPRPREDELRTIQREHEIAPMGDWNGVQKVLSKKLGLTNVFKVLDAPCSICGSIDKIREDKTRNPLCEKCYQTYRKDYLRDYMRDFMRQKRERETNHVA